MEENHRKGGNAWSLRHAGVYHHQHRTKKTDLWILLHSVPESVVEKRLLELGAQAEFHQTERARLEQLATLLQGTDVQPRLSALAQQAAHCQAELARVCGKPSVLHALLFSSFFDNWRWYLRHLGTKFGEQVEAFSLTQRLSPADHLPE